MHTMNYKKNIHLYQNCDSLIEEISEYHTQILKNHLNPIGLENISKPHANSSALITPNHIYEKTIKRSIEIKNEQQEEDDLQKE
jgi:hypothetical protein